MKRTSIGTRLYITVLSIFLIFAVAFIIFQHGREKEYKIGMLNIRLQDYNTYLMEDIIHNGESSEKSINSYITSHHIEGLRVTLIDTLGSVVYDNIYKDYAAMGNHLTRDEVAEAMKNGTGTDISRHSSTTDEVYFYSATFFPKNGMIVRSALPYDDSLAQTLKADSNYLWFSLIAILLLILALYRFVKSLGDNINKLRIFASRADHNESLDTEDLVEFPGDELGEIAERIIKIYKRLQKTKEEQNVLKRQLTQNISHELKTPVASIQGYLETILENPDMNEATKKQFLQRCYAQAQRLASLLSDISTLNRLDDAPNLAAFETVDISKMVADIAKETAMQIDEHKMKFNTLLPEKV
ncbi:MAG: HAMP domain-containing histidine kinase, partial [Prevotella sp.]|nr:HAMP domain-containing histidine kinase [Prevotella sp.]